MGRARWNWLLTQHLTRTCSREWSTQHSRCTQLHNSREIGALWKESASSAVTLHADEKWCHCEKKEASLSHFLFRTGTIFQTDRCQRRCWVISPIVWLLVQQTEARHSMILLCTGRPALPISFRNHLFQYSSFPDYALPSAACYQQCWGCPKQPAHPVLPEQTHTGTASQNDEQGPFCNHHVYNKD